VTYFRDGSRAGVLEKKEDKKEEVKVAEVPKVEVPQYTVKPRPMVVHGSTYKVQTPVGTAFITVNANADGEPLEVFINVGKAGTDIYAMAAALGRVISVALRFSSHLSPHERVREIIDQMQGIGGARAMGFGKERIKSLPDAIAKVLSMHFETLNQEIVQAQKAEAKAEELAPTTVAEQPTLMSAAVASPVMAQTAVAEPKTNGHSKLFDICPSCGDVSLAHEEGCSKCYSCGYSAC
jgi:ribonucleoside-diphosphate reductase alpha chain